MGVLQATGTGVFQLDRHISGCSADCVDYIDRSFRRMAGRVMRSIRRRETSSYDFAHDARQPDPRLHPLDSVFLHVRLTSKDFEVFSGNKGRKFQSLNHRVDESYALNIHAGNNTMHVDATASSMFAINRILSTLEQIFVWDGTSLLVPGLPIALSDYPRFKWRGFMLDTARHFISVKKILHIIDAMQSMKLNVFHWHLSDAHSFSYSYDEKDGGFAAYSPSATYDRAAIRKVVEYAFDRSIRVVPEIDMPGHTASWPRHLLVQCPEVVTGDDRGVEFGINKVALHPLNEDVYRFVHILLDNIMGLFPDEYIHIGGDEVSAECWETDPKIRSWMKKHSASSGSPWHSRLQGIFTERVLGMVSARNKTAVLWDDALQSIVGMSPRSRGKVVVQWWRTWEKKAIETAHSHGIPTITSSKWYLDDLAQSWASMYHQTIDDDGPLSMGGEACLWTEQHNERGIDQTIFSRLPAVAERLWSSKTRSVFKSIARNRLARFQCKVLQQMYAVQMSSILPNFCPVYQGEPAGRTPAMLRPSASGLRFKGCETNAFMNLVPWLLLSAILLNVAVRKCRPGMARRRKVLAAR